MKQFLLPPEDGTMGKQGKCRVLQWALSWALQKAQTIFLPPASSQCSNFYPWSFAQCQRIFKFVSCSSMNLPSGWFVFPSCPGHQDSRSTTWLSFFTLSTSGSPLSLQFPGPVSVCLSLAAFSLQLCTPCLSSISPGHFWLHLLSPNVGMSPFFPWIFISPLLCPGRCLPYTFIPTGLRRGQALMATHPADVIHD